MKPSSRIWADTTLRTASSMILADLLPLLRHPCPPWIEFKQTKLLYLPVDRLRAIGLPQPPHTGRTSTVGWTSALRPGSFPSRRSSAAFFPNRMLPRLSFAFTASRPDGLEGQSLGPLLRDPAAEAVRVGRRLAWESDHAPPAGACSSAEPTDIFRSRGDDHAESTSGGNHASANSCRRCLATSFIDAGDNCRLAEP